jgi:hypothetical protein
MPSKVRMNLIVTMLLWTTSLTSCASSLTQLPPLEKRALRIDVSEPRFLYQYETCEWKYVVIKECKLETMYYDFSDPEVRQMLKLKGFKLKIVR